MLKKLWQDEAGFVVSSELVLVLTIGILMLTVGLHALSKAVNHELSDIAGAIGSLNQGYSYDGFNNPDASGGSHASAPGSAFGDTQDDCDCTEIVQVDPTAKTDVGDGSGAPESGI